MGEDLEEFFLIPVEEANYVQGDFTDDSTDVVKKQAGVSNIVLKSEVCPNSVIETDDGIKMDNSTSNEEDTDVEDDFSVNSDAIVPGDATVHVKEDQIKVPIPIKLPRDWTKMFKDPMKKLTVRI